MRVEGWGPEDYDRVRWEIYKAAVELGGTITGKHGVGAIRKRYLAMRLSPKELEIMRAIKGIFDPNNMLNPDKVLP